MYCIFTDKNTDKGNYDHIIPLSLGGSNKFCTWCDIDFNSKMGSKIDGAIANDPLIMLARSKTDTRGHSNKRPIPIWKNTRTEDGKKVSLTFGEDLKLFDVKERENVSIEENAKLKSTININRHAPLKFVLKVSLGGIYHLFGQDTNNIIDHHEIRDLVRIDADKPEFFEIASNSKIVCCDRFHPDADKGAAIYKAICQYDNLSKFMAIFYNDGIGIHVGILGSYLGSVILPIKNNKLLNKKISENNFDMGVIISMKRNSIESLPLRDWAIKLRDSIEKNSYQNKDSILK